MVMIIRLSTLTAAAVTDDAFISQEGINWSWAAELLQQLLNCAVAAGLLPALPGGSASAAAVAIRQRYSSSSSSSRAGGVTGSSSSDGGNSSCLKVIARDIVNVASSLIESAVMVSLVKGVCGTFTREPAVAEMTLHLLALRCCQINQQQEEQQDQVPMCQLSEQLGRCMRGDLLLLPDPAEQRLLQQLLPAEAVLDKLISLEPGSDDDDDLEERCIELLSSVQSMATVLLLHMDSPNWQLRSPVLSAAALQLSAELLLRAAAHWQRQYMLLPKAQRALFQSDVATLTSEQVREVEQARQQHLAHSEMPLVACCRMLHHQLHQLWATGQWQQQVQLLQQGVGQVLLQGLTLAAHCGSLDPKLDNMEELQVQNLLLTFEPHLGERLVDQLLSPCLSARCSLGHWHVSDSSS
jgi:hypothetical protein